MGLRQPPVQQPGKLPEFDIARKKAEQRVNAGGQERQDALQRRFASLGNLNSGVAMKQQQMAQDDIQRQKEDAIQTIDAQEMGEMQRRLEVKEGRDFQSSEAQKGRDFQGGMFDKEFGLKNRAFDEDRRARGFQEGMAEREFNRDSQTLDFEKARAIIDSGNAGAISDMLDQISQGGYGGSYQGGSGGGGGGGYGGGATGYGTSMNGTGAPRPGGGGGGGAAAGGGPDISDLERRYGGSLGMSYNPGSQMGQSQMYAIEQQMLRDGTSPARIEAFKRRYNG